MIPAQAVEAAAIARGCVWRPAKANHPACEECREQARIILEAAAPHIRVQALEEVAQVVADGGVPAYDSDGYAAWLRARAEAEWAGVRDGND